MVLSWDFPPSDRPSSIEGMLSAMQVNGAFGKVLVSRCADNPGTHKSSFWLHKTIKITDTVHVVNKAPYIC